MKMDLRHKFLNYHGLRLFFSSLDDFRKFSAQTGRPFDLGDDVYSDLFYGTDADIYVPLWASVAKTGQDVLLNHVTLDVIRFYKEFGYEPVRMDGNPPDFAGEQAGFLEYLAGCALNGTMAEEEALSAAKRFEDMFFTDTMHMISRHIRSSKAANAEPALCVIDGAVSGEWLFDGSTDSIALNALADRLISLSRRRSSPIPVEDQRVVSFASCSDCGSKCKMLATVCEGCILNIEPDRNGTPIRFTGCPRGLAYPQTFLTSKRLRFPMERTGLRGDGKFRRITWKEATEKIAAITRESGEKYGPGSRFVINAAGVSAAVRGDRFMKNLLALDGGYLNYYNYYSAACAVYIMPYIYGQVLSGNHPSTYTESKLIIMWGFNPADCHYGPNTRDYFMKAKEKGARIIVIDPRISDTAMTMADRWIPIRPSSDTAMADAMAYVIFKEGLQDQDFMDKYCIGFDEDHMPEGIPYGESYRSYLFGVKDGVEKTPQWAEQICGVPAETIRDLAIEYATVKPAALLPGYSVQRTLTGEQACRGFIALACMTGNAGVTGGSTGAPYLRIGHDSPGMKLIPDPYPGEIPVFRWTQAIDRPETIEPKYTGLKGTDRLDSGIKVIYSLASGIVINQHSNINDTRRILRDTGKLDALILSDLFMTPSARFADILLPGISFFEYENIPSPWSSEDYLIYCHQVTSPLFEGRFEYYWIRETARLMGLEDKFNDGHENLESWLRAVYEDFRDTEPNLPDFDTFRKRGYHVFSRLPSLLAFDENINKGVPFNTPSGKIEIFSRTLYDMGRPEDIPAIPKYIYCAEGPLDPMREKYPLQLIAYHTRRRCHSQHEENALLRELDPAGLWINPSDAAARGIKDGDTVEVFNDRGVMRIPAKVTERVTPGVIAVSEGGWYRPAADGADTGGSINILTMTDKATPLANGNPQHTNLADVRLYKNGAV